MTKQNFKCVVVDTTVAGTEIKAVSLPHRPSLEQIYELIHCDCIDVRTVRMEANKVEYFDIYCDDEALIKEGDKILSIITLNDYDPLDNNRYPLFGSVMICKSNEQGETVSLSDKEIQTVMEQICHASVKVGDKFEERQILITLF